jgi:hypothetical protein
MRLLLNRRAELEQLVRHRLVGRAQDVYEPEQDVSMLPRELAPGPGYLRPGVRLIVLGKQGNGLPLLAGATGTPNTVNVILDGEGELRSCQAR